MPVLIPKRAESQDTRSTSRAGITPNTQQLTSNEPVTSLITLGLGPFSIFISSPFSLGGVEESILLGVKG